MIARVTDDGLEALTNSLIGNSPIGTIVSYAGTSIPAGYLLCNGSSFEADTYPELTALLGGATTPSITDTTTLGYKIIKALMITGGSVGSVASVVTVPNIEIGTVFAFAGTTCPEHYLPCDGSEFDTTKYSELYNILGSNKLPDYREVVLVGAGQNTTDSIENHDTYTVGQFKDDQLQSHKHNLRQVDGNYTNSKTWPILTPFDVANSEALRTHYDYSAVNVYETVNARVGEVTHGKQKGVLYIIKADREDMTDLVDKIDGDYTLGNYVDISSYTSVDNYFKVPKDGYVIMGTPYNKVGNRVNLMEVSMAGIPDFCLALARTVLSGYSDFGSVFVKKGMKIYHEPTDVYNYIRYVPLEIEE